MTSKLGAGTAGGVPDATNVDRWVVESSRRTGRPLRDGGRAASRAATSSRKSRMRSSRSRTAETVACRRRSTSRWSGGGELEAQDPDQRRALEVAHDLQGVGRDRRAAAARRARTAGRPRRRPPARRRSRPARSRRRTRGSARARAGSPWPRAGGARTSARPPRATPSPPASSADSPCASSRNASCARPRPRRNGRPARRGTRRRRSSAGRSAGRGADPRSEDEVTTSNVRPTASTSCTSLNGCRPPPIRERGRRTPLAMTRSLPRRGVRTVRTRSASPRSIVRRTIASVL